MLVLVAVLLSGGGACGGVVVVLGFGRAVGLLSGVRGGRGVMGSRVRMKWPAQKIPYLWRVPQSFVQLFVCTWGEALVPSPHKLCGSRKIDGLVFLLPAPSCSFVILGFVRASPNSPRHKIAE